jgi:hypothetical protein
VESVGFGFQSVLEGFKESYVFGYIVVLMADPPGDANGFTVRSFD